MLPCFSGRRPWWGLWQWTVKRAVLQVLHEPLPESCHHLKCHRLYSHVGCTYRYNVKEIRVFDFFLDFFEGFLIHALSQRVRTDSSYKAQSNPWSHGRAYRFLADFHSSGQVIHSPQLSFFICQNSFMSTDKCWKAYLSFEVVWNYQLQRYFIMQGSWSKDGMCSVECTPVMTAFCSQLEKLLVCWAREGAAAAQGISLSGQ